MKMSFIIKNSYNKINLKKIQHNTTQYISLIKIYHKIHEIAYIYKTIFI